MNKFLLTTLLCIITLAGSGQNKDLFLYKYYTNTSGVSCVFSNKTDAFSLQVNGKNIKPARVESLPAENQHFIDIDGMSLQLSTVPLPAVPESYHLNNLTLDQQKELLLGYVDYEMDYLRNELKLKTTSFKQKWTVVNSKLFIMWIFEQEHRKNDNTSVNGQIYTATICYNQILTINVPLFNKAGYWDNAYKLINNVSSTLKLYKLH